MSWELQVKLKLGDGTEEWRAVRPSHSKKPYSYDTKEAAEEMLRICYGSLTREQARVREQG